MTLNEWGALWFGVVIGWVTYRTIRRSPTGGLSDIATVIGAVGGGAVTALFPSTGRPFGAYGVGLAIGFFTYFVTALILAAASKGGVETVNEWLGSNPAPRPPGRREPVPVPVDDDEAPAMPGR